MEAELSENLLRLARIYCRETGLAPSTTGMRAAHDARFFKRIESGKGFTVRTYDTVIGWFSSNWPTKADWPGHILRPAVSALVGTRHVRESSQPSADPEMVGSR